MGNAGVLLRAYIYMRLLGREGMSQVGEFATLNANYLLAQAAGGGFRRGLSRNGGRATSSSSLCGDRRGSSNVTAMDFAKRLLDHGFHAPTTYFPLLVPECLLIEPTETESKDALDAFVAAMAHILKEAEEEPEHVRSAPHTMPVRRLDDVRAAKQLDLTWKPTRNSVRQPTAAAPGSAPRPRCSHARASVPGRSTGRSRAASIASCAPRGRAGSASWARFAKKRRSVRNSPCR